MTKEIDKFDILESNFESILYDFNFHKIKLAMQATDWMWVQDGGMFRTPTVQEMENCLRRLYKNCIDDMKKGQITASRESGGFGVSISEINNVNIYFILEEKDSMDIE